MSTKHTPEKSTFTSGPWEAVRDHPDKRTAEGMISIYPVSRSMFGCKESSLSIADMYNCDTTEQVANARLIASAPAMFEALKALTNQIEAQFSYHRDEYGQDLPADEVTYHLAPIFDPLIREAKAALAQAEPATPAQPERL